MTTGEKVHWSQEIFKSKSVASKFFDDKNIRLWDITTGQIIRTINVSGGSGVHAIAFLPGGTQLATLWGEGHNGMVEFLHAE